MPPKAFFVFLSMRVVCLLLQLTLLGAQHCGEMRSDIFSRPNPKEIRLNDNECLARVVIGSWCEWEALETGHGVTACQRGLNIRWRRRVCSCPPPKPLESSQTWCTPAKNASSVARLRTEQTRLEALKMVVWENSSLWNLTQPFRRPGSLTNSLLACLQMDECFFHTGATYAGSVSVSRLGKSCLPWANFKSELEALGLSNRQLELFMATNPENYCRNPLAELDHTLFYNSKLKPWCFTTPGRRQPGNWDYCEIRRCGSFHFHGSVFYKQFDINPSLTDRATMFSGTFAINDAIDRDPAGDVNAESCFETCRFRCEKLALMNVRRISYNSLIRVCQCLNESFIPNPELQFLDQFFDNFTTNLGHTSFEQYNAYYFPLESPWSAPFKSLEWKDCLLFNTVFRCPYFARDAQHYLFASTFELALPKNCYETNNMMHWDDLDTMSIFGAMGNFRLLVALRDGSRHVAHWSSRSNAGTNLATLCTHKTSNTVSCPMFSATSKLDTNSNFNNVVDEDYQWLIIDVGSHRHIALVKLRSRSVTVGHELRHIEVLLRAAPLPNWLVEKKFSSSDGTRGLRTEYFSSATMTEKMLWWRCEDLKFHESASYAYAECSTHQRTRWVMLRSKVHTDNLEMKHMMGYDWLDFYEMGRLNFDEVSVYEMPLDRMNCLTMHHPPMGPEYADYWEDLYSFDGDGQPLDPPVFTQTHPQFTLPLTTHDSVHPDERFLQEEWDVEACGDWEIMEDTTMVGVPAKLKITISIGDSRGMKCYNWKEALDETRSSNCKRTVYFRVDNATGEVVHYPEFGRSYGLAVERANCQFVCAVARECKAFEFSANSFCRLHLISYSLDTMYAYEKNTVYGRKSDVMCTTNPFTWNNPYHPYYRMLQDLLTDTKFFR